MQVAATVLGVLHDRGRKGLACNELYRQLWNNLHKLDEFLVRTVRRRCHGGCPPSRQTRPARAARTRPTRVGGVHGNQTA